MLNFWDEDGKKQSWDLSEMRDDDDGEDAVDADADGGAAAVGAAVSAEVVTMAPVGDPQSSFFGGNTDPQAALFAAAAKYTFQFQIKIKGFVGGTSAQSYEEKRAQEHVVEVMLDYLPLRLAGDPWKDLFEANGYDHTGDPDTARESRRPFGAGACSVFWEGRGIPFSAFDLGLFDAIKANVRNKTGSMYKLLSKERTDRVRGCLFVTRPILGNETKQKMADPLDVMVKAAVQKELLPPDKALHYFRSRAETDFDDDAEVKFVYREMGNHRSFKETLLAWLEECAKEDEAYTVTQQGGARSLEGPSRYPSLQCAATGEPPPRNRRRHAAVP